MIISGYNMLLMVDGYQNDGTLTSMLYKRCKYARAPTSDMHPISAAHKGNLNSLASHVTITPLAILPLTLVLASLLSPGYSKISFPIDKHLILVVLPSSLPLLLAPSSHRSPLGRLQMLSRLPGTLTPSSPTQSPPRQSEMPRRNIHLRL